MADRLECGQACSFPVAGANEGDNRDTVRARQRARSPRTVTAYDQSEVGAGVKCVIGKRDAIEEGTDDCRRYALVIAVRIGSECLGQRLAGLSRPGGMELGIQKEMIVRVGMSA